VRARRGRRWTARARLGSAGLERGSGTSLATKRRGTTASSSGEQGAAPTTARAGERQGARVGREREESSAESFYREGKGERQRAPGGEKTVSRSLMEAAITSTLMAAISSLIKRLSGGGNEGGGGGGYWCKEEEGTRVLGAGRGARTVRRRRWVEEKGSRGPDGWGPCAIKRAVGEMGKRGRLGRLVGRRLGFVSFFSFPFLFYFKNINIFFN
jgi:hypothetical protein